MKRCGNYAEAPRITIGSMEFEMRMSDGDVYAAGRRILADCVQLCVSDEYAVCDMIRSICALLDDVLGEGAMAKIAGGRAVTLPFALKTFNVVMQTCAARYREYIRHEYLPPVRSTK